MDNLELFNEVVNRGLWVSEPGPLQLSFVISDIDGNAVAKAKSLPVALAVAYGKVVKEVNKTHETN